MNRLLFPLLIVLLTKPLLVHTQCRAVNKAFSTGEVLKFDIKYNWGPVWISAGYVTFETKAIQFGNRPAYQLKASGKSLPSYDWIFKVDNTYESIADRETLQPFRFSQDTHEGGYTTRNSYTFDQQRKRLFTDTWNSKTGAQKDTFLLNKCILDIMSLFYTFRNFNLEPYKINDTIPFWCAIDNEVFNLYARYLGKVNLTLSDGSKFRCIKLSGMLVEGTIFKGGEDIIVYLTDDANRVPVLVDAKIIVGSIKVLFKDAEHLRNPVTSKINDPKPKK